MSTVKPPPPLSVATLRNAPSTPLALAVRVSDAVRALNVGQGLEATRLSNAPSGTLAPATLAKGTIQVQTVLGPITLQTSYPVPRGAVLSLVLLQQGPQPQFQITAINAKPVAPTPQPNVPAPQTGPPAKALAPGQTLNATLLRPAFATPQKPAGPPGASQTTPNDIAMPSRVSINPQATASPALNVPRQVQTSPRSVVSQPGTPQTETPKTEAPQGARTIIQRTRVAQTPDTAAPKSTPQRQSPAARNVSQTPTPPPTPTKGTSPVVLPAGTRLRLTIQRIDAPNAAVTTPVLNSAKDVAPALSARSVLTGTLTGRTALGQPIVQTPSALFALDTRTTSIDGTRVSLRLDSTPQPPPGSQTPFSAGRADELTSSASWSNLNDALRALALVDPQRLIQVSNRALPQPGARLGTQMLFFLSALKGGDVRSLFGDTALRLIDKKRPGLSGRLNDDFRTLAKQANEPQQGDWRLALIPMWSGTQLEQVRFFWRHANSQDTLEEDGEETRFVLDVDLSRMGHLQIDGLLKAKRQHMDLIVRTDTPLPTDWRREITDIFNQGRDITGLGGSVAFQAVPANFVPFSETQTPEPAPGFYA